MASPYVRSEPAPLRRSAPAAAAEPREDPAEVTRLPGLRERKREKLRERLVDAGMRLFTERGFDRVSIDDIVAEVDVSVRTFFRYFPSKGALVVSWHEKLNADLLRGILTQPTSTPPLIAARRELTRLMESYETNRDRAVGIARLMQATPSVQTELAGSNLRVQRDLADGIAARWRLSPESLVAPTTAAAVIALANVAIEAWLNRGGIESLGALVDEAFETLAETLSAAAGTAEPKRRSAGRP